MNTTRRKFCTDLLLKGGALISLPILAARCGGQTKETSATETPTTESTKVTTEYVPTSCSDLSGVDESEINKRKALGYVDQTPISDNSCENCKLYIPAKPGTSCGGCQLFKGPVTNEGYCTYWADPAA